MLLNTFIWKREYISFFLANISAFIFSKKSHTKILFKTLISKFLAYFFMKYIVLDPLLDRQMLRKRILLRKCNFLSSRKQNNYNNLMIMMIFLIVSSMIKKTSQITRNIIYYITRYFIILALAFCDKIFFFWREIPSQFLFISFIKFHIFLIGLHVFSFLILLFYISNIC